MIKYLGVFKKVKLEANIIFYRTNMNISDDK